MAYIKEYVEEENQRTFRLPYGREITPSCWTIDKEKDAILFKRRTDREPPHDNYFIFYYKGYVMDLTVYQKIFIEPNIVRWKLRWISIPKELNEEEVMEELKEAFLTYGYNGSPWWKDEEYQFEFVGE